LKVDPCSDAITKILHQLETRPGPDVHNRSEVEDVSQRCGGLIHLILPSVISTKVVTLGSSETFHVAFWKKVTHFVWYSFGYGTLGIGFPRKPHSFFQPSPASTSKISKSSRRSLKYFSASQLCRQ